MNGKEYVPGELIYFARTIDPSINNVELLPISDAHRGNPLFSPKHFQRTLTYLTNTPNAYCFLNGDLNEAAIRTSKGDLFNQVGTPQDQRDWMIAQLTPIKAKILGMTTGNHENRIYNDTGIDISKDIAQALGIPYRPEGMLLKISFGDGNDDHKGRPYVCWLYFTHGYGGARTKSAKAVKVERLASWIDADVYCQSHDHIVNVAPDIYLKPDPRTHTVTQGGHEFEAGKVRAFRKMLVKSNAYIKFGGYSEMGGFPPVDLETPIIRLHGERRLRVTVEV